MTTARIIETVLSDNSMLYDVELQQGGQFVTLSCMSEEIAQKMLELLDEGANVDIDQERERRSH